MQFNPCHSIKLKKTEEIKLTVLPLNQLLMTTQKTSQDRVLFSCVEDNRLSPAIKMHNFIDANVHKLLFCNLFKYYFAQLSLLFKDKPKKELQKTTHPSLYRYIYKNRISNVPLTSMVPSSIIISSIGKANINKLQKNSRVLVNKFVSFHYT